MAIEFLWGALTMACLVAALLFARFWSLSKDRLFLFFALAFCAFALNWLALAATRSAIESHYGVYLLRLLGFGFILVAILDRNRRRE
ncbi:MAG TPA: DUF5985 family protein [Casimicrobiaceae bacterium]|nr:DUF5985 family protein [Casimicrobiaceae bacterium]